MNKASPSDAAPSGAALPLRPLGRTGARVPALGFGVSGPHASFAVPEATTIALIQDAVARGVAMFDTAPFYGDGEAERRLGEAIEHIDRDKLFLITKAGTRRDGGRIIKDFSPDYLRRSLEDSLARLGVDAVDGFFLHGAPDAATLGPALIALDILKREGLIRFAGLCGRDADMRVATDHDGFDLLMAPARIDQDAETAALWAAARAKGLGLIGIETLSPAQKSLRTPKSVADLWYLARALKNRVSPRAPAHTREACLDWALTGGCVDVVLTSTTRAEHLTWSVERAIALGQCDLNR